MLLTDVLPKLAVDLEQLLRKHGESELAAQVPSLAIVAVADVEMIFVLRSTLSRSLRELTA